ncbi:MAG: metallopeptidase TldD-related protein [Thermoanaerobaculia bacterium]
MSRPSKHGLPSADEAVAHVEAALAQSPADETEIVWLGVRRGRAGTGAEAGLRGYGTALVRVIDRGRMGSYRTGGSDAAELADAVRQAIAQSRVKEPLPGLPHLPCDESPVEEVSGRYDDRLASWTPAEATAWLDGLALDGAGADLDWADAMVLVSNSRGLRRRARVTAVELEVRPRSGVGPGASDASRTLDGLGIDAVLERAEARRSGGPVLDLPSGPRPLVLAPEVTAALADLLNRVALSAAAYSDGTSLLREHLGVQVFDRSLDVVDDGRDAAGLPFPFDLEGTAKRRVELVSKGTPRTPALDQRQAAQLGLPPTGCSVSGNDALAMNLIVVPGEASDMSLLDAAEGGLWVGALDGLECLDAARLEFRAHARGLRHIREGALAERAPDALWHDSLLRLLSERPLLGASRARRLSRDGFLGGILAPAVTVSGEALQALEGSAVQRTKTSV